MTGDSDDNGGPYAGVSGWIEKQATQSDRTLHDMNNAMASLLANLSLGLEKIAEDHPAHPRIAAANRAANRMQELMTSLDRGRGK